MNCLALLALASISQVTVVSTAEQNLRVAADEAATFAPAVETPPAAGVLNIGLDATAMPSNELRPTPSYVSLPRALPAQCASGSCGVQAADSQRRANQQYRDHRKQYAQPAEQRTYLFNGPIARGLRWRR